MSRITPKLQVTIPRAIADQLQLRPGDEIHSVAAGDSIRVIPGAPPDQPANRAAALRFFDRATERQRRRDANPAAPARDRGWTREDLYDRGRAR